MKRSIGVVTVARSDYGNYRPLLREIAAAPDLELRVFAGGSHLVPSQGMTIREIEADGFPISARVDMKICGDEPLDIAAAMAEGVKGFAEAFDRHRPDILVLYGDRFDMFAAAVAAFPMRIPLAHIHGGESTEGQIDEVIRHSLTKISHLHFASLEAYARRIIQMGEEPWRVIVSGAPALDVLKEFRPLSAKDIHARFGCDVSKPFLLVTFHPETLAFEDTEQNGRELFGALKDSGLPHIITAPNTDTRSSVLSSVIHDHLKMTPNATFVANLGTQAYFTLMQNAVAMVGNSSSGIVEAASFGLPVINVGDRQRGRIRGENVLDVACRRGEIVHALTKATEEAFREKCRSIRNIHGDGRASERIVDRLRSVSIDRVLLVKHFHDLPSIP